MSVRTTLVLRAFGIAVLALALPIAPHALAAERVTITTPYPAVVADPGGSVRFPLTIDAVGSGTLALEATGQPDGWTTSFRGSGSTVAAVRIDDGAAASVDFEVKVPADAVPGSYRMVVRAAETGGGSGSLPVAIEVSDAGAGAVTLEARYPALKGPSDATYRFDLTLSNDTSQQQTFALQAAGPAGWTIDARPSGSQQAATAVVDAGATAQVEVTAEPAAGVAAGAYPITVEAIGGPAVARAELAVEIVGSYELEVSTPDGRLNADVTAGNPSPLTLEVRNLGSAPLAGVTLTATPPQGWQVTFDPELIEGLAPNDVAAVTATIVAADDAIAGDYILTIGAENDQASDEADIRTTVQTSPLWGLVGIAAIALVLAGLAFVFRRFGRR